MGVIGLGAFDGGKSPGCGLVGSVFALFGGVNEILGGVEDNMRGKPVYFDDGIE